CSRCREVSRRGPGGWVGCGGRTCCLPRAGVGPRLGEAAEGGRVDTRRVERRHLEGCALEGLSLRRYGPPSVVSMRCPDATPPIASRDVPNHRQAADRGGPALPRALCPRPGRVVPGLGAGWLHRG